jgi:hypothetical protein
MLMLVEIQKPSFGKVIYMFFRVKLKDFSLFAFLSHIWVSHLFQAQNRTPQPQA